MSWTSNMSGHCETELEENASALVLQTAAKYVNVTAWSFYGTYNTYTLDSVIPQNVVTPVNEIPGVDLSWQPPSITFTDPVAAKPPYTGKGDIPDGFELPAPITVPPVGSVPDMVPVSEGSVTEFPKV